MKEQSRESFDGTTWSAGMIEHEEAKKLIDRWIAELPTLPRHEQLTVRCAFDVDRSIIAWEVSSGDDNTAPPAEYQPNLRAVMDEGWKAQRSSMVASLIQTLAPELKKQLDAEEAGEPGRAQVHLCPDSLYGSMVRSFSASMTAYLRARMSVGGKAGDWVSKLVVCPVCRVPFAAYQQGGRDAPPGAVDDITGQYRRMMEEAGVGPIAPAAPTQHKAFLVLGIPSMAAKKPDPRNNN